MTEGVVKVNPEAECWASYTGNFEDSVVAQEMTLAMIMTDLTLIQISAPAGVISGWQERGIATIAHIEDKYKTAPDVIITSGVRCR